MTCRLTYELSSLWVKMFCAFCHKKCNIWDFDNYIVIQLSGSCETLGHIPLLLCNYFKIYSHRRNLIYLILYAYSVTISIFPPWQIYLEIISQVSNKSISSLAYIIINKIWIKMKYPWPVTETRVDGLSLLTDKNKWFIDFMKTFENIRRNYQ